MKQGYLSIVTTLGAGRLENQDSILSGCRDFPVHRSIQTGSGAQEVPYPVYGIWVEFYLRGCLYLGCTAPNGKMITEKQRGKKFGNQQSWPNLGTILSFSEGIEEDHEKSQSGCLVSRPNSDRLLLNKASSLDIQWILIVKQSRREGNQSFM
jgi:hypothetical protein